jgi:hypothetical protein
MKKILMICLGLALLAPASFAAHPEKGKKCKQGRHHSCHKHVKRHHTPTKSN